MLGAILGITNTVRLCYLYDNGHMDATGSTQVCGCHTGNYNTVRLCSCLAAEGTGLRHGQLAGSVWRCCAAAADHKAAKGGTRSSSRCGLKSSVRTGEVSWNLWMEAIGWLGTIHLQGTYYV